MGYGTDRKGGAAPGAGRGARSTGLDPGKVTRTQMLSRRAPDAPSAEAIQHAAAEGVAGPGGDLPHFDEIQRAFGPDHDVGGVQAHVGGAAADATAAMGAEAYATGDHVAFGEAPTLHTAAHEAAHVVQQRAGVHLKGGVGQAGDPHEQHADAVADAVVRGESASALLDAYTGGSATPATGLVQRQEAAGSREADIARAAAEIERDWAAEADQSLAARLRRFGSRYEPQLRLRWLSRIAQTTDLANDIVIAAEERWKTRTSTALRQELAANPVDGATALTAARGASWYRLVRDVAGWRAFEDGATSDVEHAAAAVFRTRVVSELSAFDSLRRAPATRVQPLANAVASRVLEARSDEQQSIGLSVPMREAFYDELEALVRRTRSATIATCFIRAMTDVMVSNVDDPNVRAEVPARDRRLRDLLIELGVPSAQVDEARDAYDDAQTAKMELMDADIHRNSVEVEYIKLYTGIRQAVQNVGEAWIARKTQSRRDGIAEIDSARVWVSRGVNVAWAFCPGPAYAVPVVLAGTIADIFLEAERGAQQAELEQYEARLRQRLADVLEGNLGDITHHARRDFERIDNGRLPPLATNFQTIGQIEALYTQHLTRSLGE